jgi:hypothetical protein
MEPFQVLQNQSLHLELVQVVVVRLEGKISPWVGSLVHLEK